ncbi:hypothetical protein [Opitutus terrae]|uniref:von Willebrand factor, type A n=1 Tax=Opitutus terrae (strain DSM 11246 / JCM 15787 / PB90-1) TaxID=452637 RepID=B2A003_OPITP|nr:hypothetical protein [Opitutus terrae]ACB77339.1 von Willebrand factor, type A [Opitutus terrae PB90-1]
MSSRARRLLAVILLLLLGLAALLLIRCGHPATPQATAAAQSAPATPTTTSSSTPAAPAPATGPKPEVLSPATVKVPAQVAAGAAFHVEWTGPDNAGDYVTIVRPEAQAAEYGHYVDTRRGTPLELTAPMETGAYEVRYVTAASHTVLGHAAIEVLPITATLSAPEEVELGKAIEVTWTGPNNAQDYITIVAKDTPDGRYGNYTETKEGSPLSVRAPTEAGAAELRYMTGQGSKVLARRDVKIVMPETSVSGPEQVVAGAAFTATWVGPNNPGDYVTIVAQGTPDGRYQNYAETRRGSSLQITALIEPGEAELRYMTGQGSKVLARRPIRIVPAEISLDAPDEAIAGTKVPVTWKGPNNAGDYITIVPASLPDGRYAGYADTRTGSPAQIAAPKEAGPAEIRYMSGQGAKVLARRSLTLKREG